ncbi:MAG: hypothetical protein ACKN9T_10035 [Candidatus Methylumidiphilus sp.]
MGLFDVNAAAFPCTVVYVHKQSGLAPKHCKPCAHAIGFCAQALMAVRPSKAALFPCFAVGAPIQNAFVSLPSSIVLTLRANRALECKIYLARIFKGLRPVQDKSCTPVLAYVNGFDAPRGNDQSRRGTLENRARVHFPGNTQRILQTVPPIR